MSDNVLNFASAKSCLVRIPKDAVKPPMTALNPIKGANIGASAACNVAKPPAATLAPAPVANKAGGNIENPLFAFFNCPDVPLTVLLNVVAPLFTFLKAATAWVALTLSSTFETATTKQ